CPRKEKGRLIYFADSRSLVGNSLCPPPVYPFAQRVRDQDTRSEFVWTILVGLKPDLQANQNARTHTFGTSRQPRAIRKCVGGWRLSCNRMQRRSRPRYRSRVDQVIMPS